MARQRRHAALARMVTAAGSAGDYAEPWRRSPELWEFYRDEAQVLRELQQEWRTTLAGAVYCAIESGNGDLSHDVASAWTTVRRRHHHLRAILEAHQDHPAIAAAMTKERSLLACLLSQADSASSRFGTSLSTPARVA